MLGLLDEQYPDHWISRGRPIPWPPRFKLDLNLLDFFFYSSLENIVYENTLTTRLGITN